MKLRDMTTILEHCQGEHHIAFHDFYISFLSLNSTILYHFARIMSFYNALHVKIYFVVVNLHSRHAPRIASDKFDKARLSFCIPKPLKACDWLQWEIYTQCLDNDQWQYSCIK